MKYKITPSTIGDAVLTVPGDKSISHRALLLGGVATGTTHISGFLDGEDCLATLAAMSDLGVAVQRHSATDISINGVGLHGLSVARTDLNLGNSGTAMRLLAGLLSGQSFRSVLRGDASLSGRPMTRIIEPLSKMGAAIDSDDGKPPLNIRGRSELIALDYTLPMASAQVKSAILLAGLYAQGSTCVQEPAITRDHTERMLRTMGVVVATDQNTIAIEGGQQPEARDIEVPGDLSSAAFVILAALLGNNTDVLIQNVGINPSRYGVLDILRSMGAQLTLENERSLGTEPVADIRVRSSALQGVTVDPAMVSLAIDEFPVLFVAAAAAQGTTTFSGLGELRVKETDRIATMAIALQAIGVSIGETPDGAVVQGGEIRGGSVESGGDHRIAMAMAIAGSIASDELEINDVANVDTSFPGFCSVMQSCGLAIQAIEEHL